MDFNIKTISQLFNLWPLTVFGGAIVQFQMEEPDRSNLYGVKII
jgi:hypothetical protein